MVLFIMDVLVSRLRSDPSWHIKQGLMTSDVFIGLPDSFTDDISWMSSRHVIVLPTKHEDISILLIIRGPTNITESHVPVRISSEIGYLEFPSRLSSSSSEKYRSFVFLIFLEKCLTNIAFKKGSLCLMSPASEATSNIRPIMRLTSCNIQTIWLSSQCPPEGAKPQSLKEPTNFELAKFILENAPFWRISARIRRPLKILWSSGSR